MSTDRRIWPISSSERCRGPRGSRGGCWAGRWPGHPGGSAPLVGDPDHQLAVEDADDLLAGVQAHTAGVTGWDAAAGDQQTLQAVRVAGDQAESGIGGRSKVAK